MENVIENNKLVAEFMEYPGDGHGMYFHPYNGTEELVSPDYLPYHKSSKWLDQVVEKIKALGYKVELHYNGLHKHYKAKIKRPDNGLDLPWFAENIMDCLYPAVVEFIEWYNENQKS